MKIARLIITFDCNRSCKLCCNKYENMKQLMKYIHIEELQAYDMVLITGGEPMLDVERTLKIIEKIRAQNFERTIYFYTALYKNEIGQILSMVDGIHYTIHPPVNQSDIDGFNNFQEMIKGIDKSFRLYIEPEVDIPIAIIPSRWKRVEVKPWIKETELQLPKNEELFILKE